MQQPREIDCSAKQDRSVRGNRNGFCANRGINRFSTFKDAMPRRSENWIFPIPIPRYAINKMPACPPSRERRITRKSIFTFMSAERIGDSTSRIIRESDGCSRLRAREWLIYAGAIKRISYTAGQRNKNGRAYSRESIPGMLLVIPERFRGINGSFQKSRTLRPRACTDTICL